MEKVFIIAEAGINHNGSVRTAAKMIDEAARAGADAVKFQTFRAEMTISRFAPKADYQKKTTDKDESQLEMAKKLELDMDAHKYLMSYCRRRKIGFLSTPFDLDSVDLLCRLGLKVFKIPSGEITNLLYLRKVGRLKKKVILSTGMADLKEIRKAMGILTRYGTRKNDITVLHCNTAYPTPYEDVNLLAMLSIKRSLKVKVGYSDHTIGIDVPVAAVALGATIIEKHFTLNRNMEGPDHKASLEPDELAKMVRSIRGIEKAMGTGLKRSSVSESINKPIARKSIVAARDIIKGEIFTKENLTIKRPGTGITPMNWDRVIGRSSKRDFKEDEAIIL